MSHNHHDLHTREFARQLGIDRRYDSEGNNIIDRNPTHYNHRRTRGDYTHTQYNRGNTSNINQSIRNTASNSRESESVRGARINYSAGRAFSVAASTATKVASIATKPIKENQPRENPPRDINDIPAPISTRNQQDEKNNKTQSIIAGVEGGLETAAAIGSILL